MKRPPPPSHPGIAGAGGGSRAWTAGGRRGARRALRGASGHSGGFSVLELVLVLVVIGLVLATGSSFVPGMNEARLLARSKQKMSEARSALLNFSATNHRLPCPADPALALGDPGFGLEDCGLDTGIVPFETLLVDEPFLDASARPIFYAVYRNAGIDADLAAVTNLEDGIDEPLPVINAKDFCQAVRNGAVDAGTAFASTSTEITTGSGGCSATAFVNRAFVTASAGIDDADGDGDPLDGYNADATALCFASPRQGRSRLYDDLVAAVSFANLFGEVCL